MGYRLLIADDSSVTRMILKKTIDMTGVPVDAVIEAGNGQEALDRLAEQPVDAVLADINMPIMNGMEMVASILANDKLANTPVVIISTHAKDIRIQELCSQGVKGYIHKPFTPETVRDVLCEVLAVNNEQ